MEQNSGPPPGYPQQGPSNDQPTPFQPAQDGKDGKKGYSGMLPEPSRRRSMMTNSFLQSLICGWAAAPRRSPSGRTAPCDWLSPAAAGLSTAAVSGRVSGELRLPGTSHSKQEVCATFKNAVGSDIAACARAAPASGQLLPSVPRRTGMPSSAEVCAADEGPTLHPPLWHMTKRMLHAAATSQLCWLSFVFA